MASSDWEARGCSVPDSWQLTAAILRLRSVTELGWWRGVGTTAREEIEAVLTLLKEFQEDLENAQDGVAALGLPRSRRGSNSRRDSGGRAAVLRRDSPLLHLMDDHSGDTPPMTRTLTDSRRWLLQTFTAADLEAAEGHEAGAESRNRKRGGSDHSNCMGPRMSMRRDTQELDMSLGIVLGSTEAQPFLKRVGHLDFDAIGFWELDCVGKKPLQCLGAHSVQNGLIKSLVSQGKVPEAVSSRFQSCFTRFLAEIDELYAEENPYHNSSHAADVMMTMEWFLNSDYMRSQVSTLDHFMVLIAAAIHDVAHPGRSNLFLSKTMHPLAVAYNDKSILENMHLAKSFETMQQDLSTNWFALLPRAHRQDDGDVAPVNLQQYVRRGLIDMVLATDMAKHADHVHRIEALAEEERERREGTLWSEEVDDVPVGRQAQKQEALERKLTLLECVLHAADISNPCKPRPIMLRWTERVLAEFWEQGDEERSLGVDVSPLCDRESGQKAIPKGQLGFITFVIQPFYTPIAKLIPEAKEAVQQLAANKAFWEEMDRQQVGSDKLFNFAGSQR